MNFFRRVPRLVLLFLLAFLLMELLPVKLALLGLLGFFNSGWYSVLKGNLYSEIRGKSAAMLVLDNAAAVFGKLIPLAIGLAAAL